MEGGVKFPLACSNKGEKRRKSTAGRNLSIIFLFIVKLSQEGEATPQGTEIILKHTVAQRHLRFMMAFLVG